MVAHAATGWTLLEKQTVQPPVSTVLVMGWYVAKHYSGESTGRPPLQPILVQ